MKNRKRSKARASIDEERQITESMARLANAGLLGPISLDPDSGEGVFSLSPEVHRLLMAGRDLAREPGFIEAFRTGDAVQVRAWLVVESARLDPDPDGDDSEPPS